MQLTVKPVVSDQFSINPLFNNTLLIKGDDLSAVVMVFILWTITIKEACTYPHISLTAVKKCFL
jgi:hypothetical protein